jgi:hypothetical protein
MARTESEELRLTVERFLHNPNNEVHCELIRATRLYKSSFFDTKAPSRSWQDIDQFQHDIRDSAIDSHAAAAGLTQVQATPLQYERIKATEKLDTAVAGLKSNPTSSYRIAVASAASAYVEAHAKIEKKVLVELRHESDHRKDWGSAFVTITGNAGELGKGTISGLKEWYHLNPINLMLAEDCLIDWESQIETFLRSRAAAAAGTSSLIHVNRCSNGSFWFVRFSTTE